MGNVDDTQGLAEVLENQINRNGIRGVSYAEDGQKYYEFDIAPLKQAILQWVSDEVVGEDLPDDMFGSWTRRKDGSMILLSDEIIVTNNRNSKQRNTLKAHGWKEGK